MSKHISKFVCSRCLAISISLSKKSISLHCEVRRLYKIVYKITVKLLLISC
nr:MAG TPA: General transcription factor IIH subunit repair, TFIIH, TFIIH interaction.4A [Bacteriophage sp.]